MHKIKNFFGIKKIFQNFFLSFLIFFSFFSPIIQSDFIGFGGENNVFATGATVVDNAQSTTQSTNNKDVKTSETSESTTQNPNSKTAQAGVEIIMSIISGITIFTMRIINWAGFLLHPSTVFDPAISGTLKSFRGLFKNVILTLSVFIIIGIALKNLFGLKGIGDLGKDIGKFIVILILINFSWFAVKLVIDIGSIVGRASFTMYEVFGKESAFTKQGYRMYGSTIVQWTGDGKGKIKKKIKEVPYDVCLLYTKNKEEAKGKWKDISSRGATLETKCHIGVDENQNPIEDTNGAITSKSKNVIILYPISDNPDLSYDLPTAILWNFIPIVEFYKIGAGTKDIGTLLVESFFSLGTAIIMVISVLAMLIVFLQRLAVLWFYLITSPIYFFEKLLGLINESWKDFFSSKFPVSNLISNAIFMPVGFGVLYSGIAILGGELFFNNGLEQGVISFQGIDYKQAAGENGNLGSVFKLIIGIGIMIGLWKGTQAIAKSSGGLAETVVDKSMGFIQDAGYQKLTGMAMNTGLFKAGGQKGLESNYKASFGDIFSEGGVVDKWKNKERIEHKNRRQAYETLYQTDDHIKDKKLAKLINDDNNTKIDNSNELFKTIKDDLKIDLTTKFGKDFEKLMTDEYKNLNDFYKNFEKILPQLTKKYGKEGANLIGQKIVAMNGAEKLGTTKLEIRAKIQNHIDGLNGNYKEILSKDILKNIKNNNKALGLGEEVTLNNKLFKISKDKGISEENLEKAVKQITGNGLTVDEAEKLGIKIKEQIKSKDYNAIIKAIEGLEKKKKEEKAEKK